MSIQALRDHKNALAIKARKLLDDKGAQTWTKEDQAEYDTIVDEMERLERQIAAHQRELDRKADDIVQNVRREGPASDPETPAVKAAAIFDRWLRNGDKAITAEEWALVRNTMSTTTPSEGGYTVQTTVAQTVIEAIRSFGGMRRAAEQFTTEQGNSLAFPTSDGTTEEGEIVAENVGASEQDVAFGTVGIPVYRWSSKVVTVPMELIQDAQIDVMGMINKRLRTRIGRAQNKKYTQGTGINEPRGMIPALQVGKLGANGQVASVTLDDLIDLQESIDDGYGDDGNMQWMLHQTSRRAVRKIKDASGRPIWMPSVDSGVTKGAPDELLGRPMIINNDMPAMAASAKSIAYGDFSYYKIRDALDIVLMRFTDSAYAKKGQVGFLAFARSGGNWTDTGGAAKVYQNPAA